MMPILGGCNSCGQILWQEESGPKFCDDCITNGLAEAAGGPIATARNDEAKVAVQVADDALAKAEDEAKKARAELEASEKELTEAKIRGAEAQAKAEASEKIRLAAEQAESERVANAARAEASVKASEEAEDPSRDPVTTNTRADGSDDFTRTRNGGRGR